MASNFEKLRQDSRAQRVLGFLVAKGLLLHNTFTPRPSAKFSIADALWVAEKIEPRVLEVLPAAIIHFSSAIKDPSKIPVKVAHVVTAIKNGQATGQSLGGIPYKDMLRWANHPLPDKRTKPAAEKRKLKSFKFPANVLSTLKEIARKRKSSETQVVESLIMSIR